MLTIIGAASAAGGPGGGGGGGGGTTTTSPFVQTTLPDPAGIAADHGFDVTGFLQSATVSGAGCPGETNAHRFGGTARINNVTITVPCNLIVQMPANTFTWADFVNGGPSTALDGAPFPSFELHAIGNTVGSRRIAGLMFFSQQSVNAGSGTITGLDFAGGSMTVDDGTGATTTVQLNDPKLTDALGNQSGRFSAGQSPDPRLSVDQANATVHSGTGYPMCIPRTGDNATGVGGTDPLCPQQNRPKVAQTCRNFGAAAVALPASGELTPPAAGQVYCSQFVMPAPPATAAATTTGPDARQQAPFEVGDFVTYSGTLVHGAAGDLISAHTVEANVGIYTQPNSKPSYTAIGEFGVGTADPNAAVPGTAIAQETQNRIFLEAETTDVKSPVDIYLPDIDPASGTVHNRWITPSQLTGENATGTPSGGITTQNTGAQPQRARVRLPKAPNGLLSDPPRTMRVSNRATCVPVTPNDVVDPGSGAITAPATAVDGCLNSPATQTTPYGIAANGLATGQYTAPTFEYIFPENVKPGDPVVPNDLWHLGFLRFGENTGGGATDSLSVGPLTPAPW